MTRDEQKQNKTVFRNILEKMEKSIGSETFAFAFSSVELISLENNKLVLGVPADFTKKLMEEHKPTLIEIAKEESNIQDIDIIITDQENAADFYFETYAQQSSKKSVLASDASTTLQRTTIKTSHIKSSTNLNQNFSFDNFVVGSSNHFAQSIATVIAKNPGVAHNPCLFYGDAGLGKTHLLHAIGNHILQHKSNYKIMCHTSEEFMTEFVTALQNNKMNEFKNKTRKLDVLILDDIQFFTGKHALQEEFYHIFNVLKREEKQMVFASDKPVNKIPDLEERLQSRFRSNMIADIQAPSEEMALGIINNALKKNMNDRVKSPEAFEIYSDVIELVIQRLRYNIRDMLGIIERVVGYQDITKNRVDTTTVRSWISVYEPRKNNQQNNTIDNIIATVASHFDVTIKDLKGKKKQRSIAWMRHITMFLLKKMTRNSLTEIGKIFEVSHVTVSNAMARIEEEVTIDSETADTIADIQEKIQGKKQKF